MDDSNGFMRCELKVDTQSAGWHRTITRILSAIKGVSYWIDVERGVAHVSGNTDVETLLKMLSKAGKHAELLRFESAAASPRFSHQPPSPALYAHHHHPYAPFHEMEPFAPDHYPVSSYRPPPPPSPTKLHRPSTCSIV